MIPSGPYALEDLDAAGGVPAVMNELKTLLTPEAADGHRAKQLVKTSKTPKF